MIVTLEMLADAQKAYHSLMTGSSMAEYRDQNGETVKYSTASAPRLLAYINYLKKELGLAEPTGPMRVWM